MHVSFLRRSLIALALTSALATGGAASAGTLVVGASEVPHAQLLEHVKPALAKEGVTLDIKVFSDYVQPNLLVADKQLDVNFFPASALSGCLQQGSWNLPRLGWTGARGAFRGILTQGEIGRRA